MSDVSGDGQPDLIRTDVVGGVDTLVIQFGDGAGSFTGGVSFPLGFVADQFALGDVNADGAPDIVVGSTGTANLIAVFLGDGTGNMSPAPGSPFFAGGIGTDGLILADMNQDNRLDIVAAHFSEEVSVHLGDGSGRFATPILTPNGPNGVGDLVAADFDNDGTHRFDRCELRQ